MNAIDLTLDIIVLLIPIPLIRSMSLSTHRKAQVIGVFALGALYVSNPPSKKAQST
jgi:hypothetical protein